MRIGDLFYIIILQVNPVGNLFLLCFTDQSFRKSIIIQIKPVGYLFLFYNYFTVQSYRRCIFITILQINPLGDIFFIIILQVNPIGNLFLLCFIDVFFTLSTVKCT